MKQDTSTHLQDSPHKEGNVGNTPPKGQPREGGNPQPGMGQHSQEEQAGRNKQDEKKENTEGIP